jgi:23S rRNA (uracil1939-C5)-methyltransferase
MMETLTLKLTTMAHGGMAMGRDKNGRPIFVPYTIPGETVRVKLIEDKGKYGRAELLEVLDPSPDRVAPCCAHFGLSGDCHFQHMTYGAQLKAKRDVVEDQLQRIGGLKKVKVQPPIANPMPWEYRIDVTLSPTAGGGLGFWSPTQSKVVPFARCCLIHPRLLQVLADMDLDLPDLRRLTLRVGVDGALLAALEVEGIEPPELEIDFPISVALVLPDDTAASLVGENYLVQSVKERDFRVSPGVFFQPSLAGAELLMAVVLSYASLTGRETVVEGYSGVGMLTAFLAGAAAEVLGIEANSDAVADAAVNLDDTQNVTLYQGSVEQILPSLNVRPAVIVVNPPSGGLSAAAIRAIVDKSPRRLIYVSSEVATLARDGKQLGRSGYKLEEIQPIDVTPQAYQIDTVSLWQRAK